MANALPLAPAQCHCPSLESRRAEGFVEVVALVGQDAPALARGWFVGVGWRG
jgi:hypothetical protein